MTSLRDVRVELRDVLRDNLTDPITARADDGKEWIYEDYPRMDAQKPRIGLSDVLLEYSSLSIGTAKRVKNGAVQITVMLDEDSSKFDVDGDGNVENEEQVLNYFVERIEDVIIDNQDTLRDSLDARYVLPQDTTVLRPDGENILKADITVEAEFVN